MEEIDWDKLEDNDSDENDDNNDNDKWFNIFTVQQLIYYGTYSCVKLNYRIKFKFKIMETYTTGFS